MEDATNIQWYLTYNEVIAKAQAIQPYFTADLAQFNSFDPWYKPAVNTELLSRIYIGLKYFSENNMVSDIKRVTDLLDITFSAVIQYYEKLNYYVDLGFKDEAVRNQIFEYADFAEARHSVKKMLALLNQAMAAISQEGIELTLLAASMPADLPNELAGLATELGTLYAELKTLKKQQLIAARERIDLFNSLWDTLNEICEDAKIIFAAHPDRLAIYDLYDTDVWNVDQAEFIHLN